MSFVERLKTGAGFQSKGQTINGGNEKPGQIDIAACQIK
jgi:hypothetical protein